MSEIESSVIKELQVELLKRNQSSGWGFLTTNELYIKYCAAYLNNAIKGSPISSRAFVEQLHRIEKSDKIESKNVVGGARGTLIWRLKA
jgi:hypothetical protein